MHVQKRNVTRLSDRVIIRREDVGGEGVLAGSSFGERPCAP